MRGESLKPKTVLQNGCVQWRQKKTEKRKRQREKRMSTNDDDPPFIMPPPVRPGFEPVVVTEAERWGRAARPSKMPTPLPENWRPARPITAAEEERLIDMQLCAKANDARKADWNAYFELWLRKSPPNRERNNENGRSMLATLKSVGEEIRRREAQRRSDQNILLIPKGPVR